MNRLYHALLALGTGLLLQTGSGPVAGEKQEETRNRLRQIYLAEIGVREQTGHNDGRRVEEYLAYVGLKKGEPWCAAFVCWALGRANIPNPRTGWSPGLFPEGRIIYRRSRGLNANTRNKVPLPGDVFGIWFAEKGRVAHVGFVDQWGEKWVVTVEGNTNAEGARDGDGVHRRRRWVGGVYWVVDYIG